MWAVDFETRFALESMSLKSNLTGTAPVHRDRLFLFQLEEKSDHDDLVHRGRGQRQRLRVLHPHPHKMAWQCLQTHLQGYLGSSQSEHWLVG